MNETGYRIMTRPIGMFQVNCYLLVNDTSRSFAVVDAPGADRALETLLENGYTARWICLTHGHIDHIAGLKKLRERLNCPVLMHADDLPMIRQVHGNPFQALLGAEEPPEPDILLSDGDTMAFEQARFRFIHTPGHTPGGICLYDEPAGNLFSGDTLFKESIGRTDLPGGNMDRLLQSIREQLWKLPDTVRVFPGHGPETTIRHERRFNPFVS